MSVHASIACFAGLHDLPIRFPRLAALAGGYYSFALRAQSYAFTVQWIDLIGYEKTISSLREQALEY